MVFFVWRHESWPRGKMQRQNAENASKTDGARCFQILSRHGGLADRVCEIVFQSGVTNDTVFYRTPSLLTTVLYAKDTCTLIKNFLCDTMDLLLTHSLHRLSGFIHGNQLNPCTSTQPLIVHSVSPILIHNHMHMYHRIYFRIKC